MSTNQKGQIGTIFINESPGENPKLKHVLHNLRATFECQTSTRAIRVKLLDDNEMFQAGDTVEILKDDWHPSS
jgi:hypothetical protein